MSKKQTDLAEALRKALVDDKDWAKWTKNKTEQENKQQ